MKAEFSSFSVFFLSFPISEKQTNTGNNNKVLNLKVRNSSILVSLFKTVQLLEMRLKNTVKKIEDNPGFTDRVRKITHLRVESGSSVFSVFLLRF